MAPDHATIVEDAPDQAGAAASRTGSVQGELV
jgi:hypothetical protein